ncbi:MAG: hypothetical protein ABIZ09_08920, partial [Rhodoferax sp.]
GPNPNEHSRPMSTLGTAPSQSLRDMAPETTLKPAPDPALDALAALQRAGLRAAQEALRTNALMVLGKDGKIEHVSPQDYLRDRAATDSDF